MQNNKTIKITQIVYINQTLIIYQMFNFNIILKPLAQKLCFIPTCDDFELVPGNVTTYKHLLKIYNGLYIKPNLTLFRQLQSQVNIILNLFTNAK